MVDIVINGKKYQVNEGTTILEACDQNGIKIPRLCFLKEINEVNACRVCLVEVEGIEDLVPSCTTKCFEGMVIATESDKVLLSRKKQIEFLISKHNFDCDNCNRSKGCFLKKAAEDLGIKESPYGSEYSDYPWDEKSVLIRDNSKCIKCGRCVSVCEKVEGLKVWDYIGKGNRISIDVRDKKKFSEIDCALCGQCIANCPTKALSSRDDIDILLEKIKDKNVKVVVQVAPSVRSAWAERLGLKRDDATVGKMVTAIRNLGVDYVFDTNFTADLTIMEEGSELFEFLKKRKDKLPMFTSCCPGWVRFMKLRHKELVHNLSTSKSPQQMFGAVAKTYFAEKVGIDKKDIFCVSIMPCTAKKYECSVKEVNSDPSYKDVDMSITTRELDTLISRAKIDVKALKESDFDSPLGIGTGAAVIFGNTGGVMEAALRTAYYLVYGKNPEADAFSVIRGKDGIRYAEVDLKGTKVKAAVVHSLKNAELLIEDLKSGKVELDFVEVMACPNGCINGGGQPEKCNVNPISERTEKIYEIDKKSKIRFSHENPEIVAIYKDYLEKPLSEKAEKLLHTDQSKWEI